MGNSYNVNAIWVAGALCLSSAFPLGATTTIFSNTNNDLLTRLNPGTTEVGDEIILTGTDRYLNYFSFEFWGTNTANANSFSGNVMAEIRFYVNNGPPYHGYATPGPTPFYDSGLFSINALTGPTPRSTLIFKAGVDFPLGGEPIPSSDITWSVQFSGMAATDSLGVDIFSPPTVGQDYPDYWANNGGWQLLTNSINMDFAAQFNAQAAAPEPSVVTLSVVGGLGILAFAHRLRRKE
jgi:hypothetical protein